MTHPTELQTLWNQIMPRKCMVLNGPRKRLCQTALKEGTIEQWRDAILALSRSRFHMQEWENGPPTIDFILRPAHRATWLERGMEARTISEHHEAQQSERPAERMEQVQQLTKATAPPVNLRQCEGPGCDKKISSSWTDSGWFCFGCTRRYG